MLGKYTYLNKFIYILKLWLTIKDFLRRSVLHTGTLNLELGHKPTKKSLSCSALKGTSQHLNKVIRESTCVYFLFFRIYFLFLWGLAWITTCIFFETIYLILATLQEVAGGKKCCFKR